MESLIYNEYLASLIKQIQFVNIKGLPGLYSPPGRMFFCNKLLQCNDDTTDLSNAIASLSLVGGEELCVNLPFAGVTFNMRIFLYFHEPWVAPDFLFSDKKFSSLTEVEDLEEKVPCLLDWKFSAEDNLFIFLSQIHNLYKQYQIKCLKSEYEVLYGEYESLLNLAKINNDDIEVFVNNNSNQWIASLLIKLPINFEDIPTALIDGNPGEPKCVLHIIVKKTDESYVPKLYLSPQVESLIGGAASLGIPPFPPESSLTEYVANLTDLLENKIRPIVLSFEMRKQFTALMMSELPVVDYNSELLNSIEASIDIDDFTFVLDIDLPPTFPKTPPSLQLRTAGTNSQQSNPTYAEDFEIESLPENSTVEDIVVSVKNSLPKWAAAFKTSSEKSSI